MAYSSIVALRTRVVTSNATPVSRLGLSLMPLELTILFDCSIESATRLDSVSLVENLRTPRTRAVRSSRLASVNLVWVVACNRKVSLNVTGRDSA